MKKRGRRLSIESLGGMKKNNFKIIIIVVSIMIISVSILIFQHKNKNESKLMFLTYDAFINTHIDEETYLNLVFVDNINSKTKEYFENDLKSIYFESNDNIEIIDYKIDKGDSYKDIKLNTLLLKVKFKKIESGSFNNLILEYSDHTNIYDLGDFQYNIFENKNNEVLRTNKNMAVSNELNVYTIVVENILDKEIRVNELSLGNFEKYLENIFIRVDGKEIEHKKDFIINPYKNIEINITFNDLGKEDLFMFSPLFVCSVDEKILKFSPTYTIYGFPINENKINEIYIKYNEMV